MTGDVTVHGSLAEAFGEAYSGTIVLRGGFAQRWFSDALEESNKGQNGDENASRREIIFAACCAESYLYEWTYDLLTSIESTSAFETILEYFPEGSRQGLKEQWREVPRLLVRNRAIGRCPVNSTKQWKEFASLCDYRNGLVHAHLSRPAVVTEGERKVFGVTLAEIETIEPGWACGVVAKAAGTVTPSWVIYP